MTCYRVLQIKRNPRTQEVSEAAPNLLQGQAAEIKDTNMRGALPRNGLCTGRF